MLKRLRDIGNTVIVVEHDEEIIRAADYIIDIGPMAGAFGGEVVFEGEIKDLITYPETQLYLMRVKDTYNRYCDLYDEALEAR